MPVHSEHDDLREFKPQWEIIADCIAGERRIKSKGTKYLPRPNSADNSPANWARYNAYVERAVFYNVVKRTLGGLIGQIFSREPQIVVPKDLELILDDANGLGVGLTQLAKKSSGQTVAFGRSGLFIDYPQTDGAVTRQELLSGDIRPMFTVYDPRNIINWRWSKRGGKLLLSLVVLREKYVVSDDGFKETFGTQYRVLRLVSDEYIQQIYKEKSDKASETLKPTGPDGRPFNELPFTFVGSDDNGPEPNPPPLYDLSSLNIAHYRNSADFEESAFIAGQPTPYFTGLTKQWVDEVLKGEVFLGSRAAIPLPQGATAGLLQADPNTLPNEAMKHKEKQMVALGAKLIEPSQVMRTATEATIDQSYETSTLSASADNVSDAFRFGLQWAARFHIGPEGLDKIKFDLNTEFDLIKLDANERAALVKEWQANAISWGEMRSNLRRAGIAITDDAQAKKDIEKDSDMLPALDMSGGNDNVTGNSNDPASANAG